MLATKFNNPLAFTYDSVVELLLIVAPPNIEIRKVLARYAQGLECAQFNSLFVIILNWHVTPLDKNESARPLNWCW